MATLTRSGYLASAAAITWASGQTLNSAASNEWTDLSDEIDNSTNKYWAVDLDISLASAAFTGAGSGIEVYLVPSVDGTNYPTWVGDVTTEQQVNNQYFAAFGRTTGTTAAQRITITGIELPSGKYKWAFRNRGGIALASSGNTVSWRPHSVSS
jgi:hypothetical protein